MVKVKAQSKKTATVRARIEPSVKKRAESVLRHVGLSPSEAINVFYRRVVADKGIPFSLNVPNKKTRKAIENMRTGHNIKKIDLRYRADLGDENVRKKIGKRKRGSLGN